MKLGGQPLRLLQALTLLTLLGCHSKETVDSTPDPQVHGEVVTIATNSPQLSALNVETASQQCPPRLPLAGRLMWNEDATARVFSPFAGIVRKLFVEVNQPVRKGAPLIEIQSPDFGQALAEARKAESDLRRADRNLNRLRSLSEHGAAPHKDLESAEADFESAQTEKDRATARLAIYGATAASSDQNFLLPSPLDGIVVEKNLNPGQEVRPDQMLANTPQFTAPLFVVTDPARLWIQVDATEVDLPHLQPGSEFTFNSRAFPGQIFTGQVAVVSESIDPATRTIKVRGTVDNRQRLLKAEMFVNVSLPSRAQVGVSVPTRAVYLKGDKHFVFIEDQPGRFSRQEVQVGPEQDGKILVVAGVQSGQRVVSEGCLLLERTMR